MAFTDLEPAELEQVVKDFDLELPTRKTKNSLVSTLDKGGVTWEDYENLYGAAPVEVEEEKIEEVKKKESNEPTVLLRMTRENPVFQERGYEWTRTHPFQVVKESDAEFLISTYEGFRPALPSEVKEYYS